MPSYLFIYRVNLTTDPASSSCLTEPCCNDPCCASLCRSNCCLVQSDTEADSMCADCCVEPWCSTHVDADAAAEDMPKCMNLGLGFNRQYATFQCFCITFGGSTLARNVHELQRVSTAAAVHKMQPVSSTVVKVR